jgi:serine/threonine protein kinase/tetratricopeptide (TPR) repeat protein
VRIEPEELVARLQAALGTQYRIERELGRGGMGMVFLATDTTLDRPVAVKVMHPDLSVHGAITQRFLAEARMIARLRHPNIVSIHTAGEATGIFYYVMDHVPGESLRERLNVTGKLDATEAVRIISDIADALGAAGQAGLVHRDVKPENILLDSATGRALLADFGIARVAAAEVGAQLTGQGVAVGTPTYMSPEQAAGEGVDSRSDLYGLGVVAYEMLAGQPPFRGPNGAAVISMQLSEKPVPLDRLRPDLPPHVIQTVMRALEKSPENRWQTGADFHAALTGESTPALRSRRRARPAVLAGAAALLLLVVAVAMALTGHDAPPRGVDPRHSILILPFDNLRQDRSVDWLREGSVNMLSLNMSQWNDLTVVDHERLHDLLGNHELEIDDQIGLEMARRLAREAGVWTVVLGDYTLAGDSLHLAARVYDVATGERISVARVDGVGQPDARPLFDQLAARLLDLSGAPGGQRADLASLTTPSLEAYRAYLRGLDQLNQWELGAAQSELERAVELDSSFGLAYYKLAITRGWLIGANDSLGEQAIRSATRFAERLPQHERTVINAYRSFIEGDYVSSQALYRSLIARDSNDADAWYGLGDALFHDTSSVNFEANQTSSLRAFRKTLGLDPSYSLAYEHIMNMLTRSAEEQPFIALVSQDSFARVYDKSGRRQLDSARVRNAVTLARSEAVATGRNWVASQPEAVRPHTNLIEAYFSSRDYRSALGELERVRSLPSGSHRADLVFTEGRIRFASGDLEGAANVFQNALDSLKAEDFSTATPMSFQEITNAASLFSYMGDLTSAARAIDLADTVRRVTRGEGTGADDPGFVHFERVALGWLYAGGSGTTRELKQLWMQAAEEARTAPSSQRSEIARTGTPAAVGLFLGPTGDSAPLKSELPALTREPQIKEIRALLALDAGNEEEARKILAESDTVHMKGGWTGEIMDRRPYAAQAYYVLGDFQRTVDILSHYEPENLGKRGFDHRWGMVGRVRLLRAAALEKLGRNADAAAQYRAVLAQWKDADKALVGEYLKQAEQGLARTTGAG